MSDLEKQLLEFWTADAAVWRQHFHKLECQSGPQTKIDRSKRESERARAEKMREARFDAASTCGPRRGGPGRKPGTKLTLEQKERIRAGVLAHQHGIAPKKRERAPH
jgi:hypothetical protein